MPVTTIQASELQAQEASCKEVGESFRKLSLDLMYLTFPCLGKRICLMKRLSIDEFNWLESLLYFAYEARKAYNIKSEESEDSDSEDLENSEEKIQNFLQEFKKNYVQSIKSVEQVERIRLKEEDLKNQFKKYMNKLTESEREELLSNPEDFEMAMLLETECEPEDEYEENLRKFESEMRSGPLSYFIPKEDLHKLDIIGTKMSLSGNTHTYSLNLEFYTVNSQMIIYNSDNQPIGQLSDQFKKPIGKNIIRVICASSKPDDNTLLGIVKLLDAEFKKPENESPERSNVDIEVCSTLYGNFVFNDEKLVIGTLPESFEYMSDDRKPGILALTVENRKFCGELGLKCL